MELASIHIHDHPSDQNKNRHLATEDDLNHRVYLPDFTIQLYLLVPIPCTETGMASTVRSALRTVWNDIANQYAPCQSLWTLPTSAVSALPVEVQLGTAQCASPNPVQEKNAPQLIHVTGALLDFAGSDGMALQDLWSSAALQCLHHAVTSVELMTTLQQQAYAFLASVNHTVATPPPSSATTPSPTTDAPTTRMAPTVAPTASSSSSLVSSPSPSVGKEGTNNSLDGITNEYQDDSSDSSSSGGVPSFMGVLAGLVVLILLLVLLLVCLVRRRRRRHKSLHGQAIQRNADVHKKHAADNHKRTVLNLAEDTPVTIKVCDRVPNQAILMMHDDPEQYHKNRNADCEEGGGRDGEYPLYMEESNSKESQPVDDDKQNDSDFDRQERGLAVPFAGSMSLSIDNHRSVQKTASQSKLLHPEDNVSIENQPTTQNSQMLHNLPPPPSNVQSNHRRSRSTNDAVPFHVVSSLMAQDQPQNSTDGSRNPSFPRRRLTHRHSMTHATPRSTNRSSSISTDEMIAANGSRRLVLDRFLAASLRALNLQHVALQSFLPGDHQDDAASGTHGTTVTVLEEDDSTVTPSLVSSSGSSNNSTPDRPETTQTPPTTNHKTPIHTHESVRYQNLKEDNETNNKAESPTPKPPPQRRRRWSASWTMQPLADASQSGKQTTLVSPENEPSSSTNTLVPIRRTWSMTGLNSSGRTRSNSFGVGDDTRGWMDSALEFGSSSLDRHQTIDQLRRQADMPSEPIFCHDDDDDNDEDDDDNEPEDPSTTAFVDSAASLSSKPLDDTESSSLSGQGAGTDMASQSQTSTTKSTSTSGSTTPKIPTIPLLSPGAPVSLQHQQEHKRRSFTVKTTGTTPIRMGCGGGVSSTQSHMDPLAVYSMGSSSMAAVSSPGDMEYDEDGNEFAPDQTWDPDDASMESSTTGGGSQQPHRAAATQLLQSLYDAKLLRTPPSGKARSHFSSTRPTITTRTNLVTSVKTASTVMTTTSLTTPPRTVTPWHPTAQPMDTTTAATLSTPDRKQSNEESAVVADSQDLQSREDEDMEGLM